ncbi:DNA replication/repair protein RecF [Polycladomyces subterraneus]|uniref:DNA replication and repair protein RecF n=1 Tax=Polycladomyces subterraneus TaxID=1016997 RepID=A0ABT8IIC9_9BACL|nr:DNA replication/repair protein RecF [Polycladomyces subterraneus]MDN4592541.1 DNA replication/repair protein RecF [Polycladomyces subterraneus]
MRVQRLELRHYRNIDHLDLTCPGELHLFIGPNAQGKTNILESLYVLALGKSHRARSHKELIQWGQSFAQLNAHVMRGEGMQRLEIRLTEQGKKVSRNGVEQRRLSEYIGTLTAVLFAPEDLALVKGSPQVRRRFLDMEIGQVSPAYVHHLSQYNKLMVQRNHLLKELFRNRRQLPLLEVLDHQLAQAAAVIWKKRATFIGRLAVWAEEIHQAITQGQERLQLRYCPSIPVESEEEEPMLAERLVRQLEKVREKEIARGSTSIGPHRDDLQLAVGETDLHTYGSQGQQRTAALSLKLAEIELIRQETGHYPILLLDDVLSELDDNRKTHLLEAIRGKVQTFVTATGLEGIGSDTLARAQVYAVKQGTLSEWR